MQHVYVTCVKGNGNNDVAGQKTTQNKTKQNKTKTKQRREQAQKLRKQTKWGKNMFILNGNGKFSYNPILLLVSLVQGQPEGRLNRLMQ